MKAPDPIREGVRGTIMIFALIVILASTLVLAGWAQMLMTAAIYPDTTAQGVKNRLALENARAMAREYMLVSLPSGATANNATWEASIAGGAWGACSVNAAASFWDSTNQLQGNPFSPIGGFSFVLTNLATFSNSVQSTPWRFLVKSRSPLLAGFPLVVHQAASTNLAWAPSSAIYYTNIVAIAGTVQLPFTSGTNLSGVGSTNGFLGYFAAPMSPYSATNQLGTAIDGITYSGATNTGFTNVTTNMIATRTNTTYWGGQISSAIDPTLTNAILYYAVPATTSTFTNLSSTRRTTYTNARITNLTILSDSETNVLHVVIPASNTNLNRITLSGTNNTRMVYLTKLGTNALTVLTATTNASYRWALASSFSNAAVSITAPSGGGRSLTITGGLRSGQTINVTGTLNLSASTNFRIGEQLTMDRILWIEDGRNR